MLGTDRDFLIKKVELLLSEKMAMLAMLRTGIAVFTIPFSMLTVLIATSEFYEYSNVVMLLIVVFVLCAALASVGAYLVFKSIKKIHVLDNMIDGIKERHKSLDSLMVE